ncbi:MAG: LOG family protein [Saprospiraceae bacterium]
MSDSINKFAQLDNEILLRKIDSVRQFLKNGTSAKNCVFQNIDFSQLKIKWQLIEIENTTFLGCNLTLEEEISLRKKGAYLYPSPQGIPYQPFRRELYTWQELMQGFLEDQPTVDLQIYEHFSRTKYNPCINEALWQRIHDHAMDDDLRDLLRFDENGMTQRKCVGFMGGHSTLRTDPFYERTALTAQLLAKNGYFVVSGGGPGTMEAANLGAYFGTYTPADLKSAIQTLAQAPHYTNPNYHHRAYEVIERFPNGMENLAIPTWFYGHEPSNLFASYIAKYFSNSIREDTLLAICLYGIVFAPGSAGTTQEIFQDATQNHYGTYNFYSPMVFLSKKRYAVDTLIYPLLRQLSYGREYHDLLYLTNEPEEVLTFLQQHPPVPVGTA